MKRVFVIPREFSGFGVQPSGTDPVTLGDTVENFQRGNSVGWDEGMQEFDRAIPVATRLPGSTEQGPQIVGTTIQILPFWLHPTPDSLRYFESINNVNVAAGAQDVQVTTVANPMTFRLPGGRTAAFRYLRLVVNNPLPAMNLFFTFKLNGAPISGLDRLTVPAVVTPASLYEDDPELSFGQGAILTLHATNNDAVIWNIGAAFSGYHYPQTTARLLSGGSQYASGNG
jgi:hypothetical protein